MPAPAGAVTQSPEHHDKGVAMLADDEMAEVIDEFITESHENLDQLDQGLVQLEQNPDKDVIARIFRTIHTIKGTSGFLGLGTLESITHVGENLLSKLRDGDLQVTIEITSGLLAMVDAVREILGHVQASRDEGPDQYTELVELLGRLNRGEAATAQPAAAQPPAEPVAVPVAGEPAALEPIAVEPVTPEPAAETATVPVAPAPVPAPAAEARPVLTAVDTPAAPKKRSRSKAKEAKGLGTIAGAGAAARAAQREETASTRLGEHLLRAGEIEEHELEKALELQAQGDHRKVGELLVEHEATTPEAVDAALKVQTEERTAAMETIRVDVRLLDDLMNLVGELVLARNQILQFTQSSGDAQFTATSQRLNLITTELQEGVMKTRMQPIENVWNKFPRVVRDLTLGCGKQARLEMEGKHTEVDKTLLEAIKDPLTHLIRNAVDHGLEAPTARVAKGKSPEGVVSLRAYHEGGQVIIEIADDGAGIDANKIRQKAVQKGLMTAEEAATRPDREIVNVIFMPGFSTAEQVSNISGRGVGMDVVKTNIEAIGGSVDVQTLVGRGTTFKVKIPLTLAIIPALLVTAGGGRYAIPQVSLLELVRLDNASGDGGIEWVQGSPVYRLRGRLLPLVFLNEVFRTESANDADVANIVVVQADDTTFGLVVDDISDTAEIVVKPLGRLLKNAAGFAGATIMGDGRVALILDLPGVAELAGVNAAAGARRADGTGSDLVRTDGQETILVVGISDRRFALPLARVARLEEIPAADVRWAGDQRVVHYRDHILPLVAVGDRLGIPTACHEAAMLQVLVCGTEERAIGLIVDDIFDIVEERLEYTQRTSTYGVRGTTILGDAVTDVLDLDVLVGDAVVVQLEVAA